MRSLPGFPSSSKSSRLCSQVSCLPITAEQANLVVFEMSSPIEKEQQKKAVIQHEVVCAAHDLQLKDQLGGVKYAWVPLRGLRQRLASNVTESLTLKDLNVQRLWSWPLRFLHKAMSFVLRNSITLVSSDLNC